MGIKSGEEKWCYRLAIGASTEGHVLLQEGLYCYRRGSKNILRVKMMS